MASTERSLGWATSGTGDGPAGGYDSTRWRANAQKTDGTGITLYGYELVAQGAGTSTLTIADGAAIINGYTYETNGSVTISTLGLGGTFSIILVANTSAGALTVLATGAGTTTVAVATVRIAIATSAQVTTIVGAVGSANVITLGSVTVSGGVISSITNAYPMSVSMQVASQIYGVMDSLGGSISVANATYVDILGYGTTTIDGSNLVTAQFTTGVFTVALAGLYQVSAAVTWDSNTTGNRTLLFALTNSNYTLDSSWQAASAALVGNATQQATGIVSLNAGSTVKAQVYQTSGATRQVTNANVKIVRL